MSRSLYGFLLLALAAPRARPHTAKWGRIVKQIGIEPE